MEVLIADRESPSADAVAHALESHGHVVRDCRDVARPDIPCAALRGAACPLDDHPIDIVVGVGPPPAVDHLGDGSLSAIRRRIPLVLIDRPNDRLKRWAAATATAFDAVHAVDQVHDSILPLHSMKALVTAIGELRQRGLAQTAVDVEVRRRDGGLLVDLFIDGRLTGPVADGLAVHVVQTLRLFDPWAKTIDASVHHVAE